MGIQEFWEKFLLKQDSQNLWKWIRTLQPVQQFSRNLASQPHAGSIPPCVVTLLPKQSLLGDNTILGPIHDAHSTSRWIRRRSADRFMEQQWVTIMGSHQPVWTGMLLNFGTVQTVYVSRSRRTAERKFWHRAVGSGHGTSYSNI